MPAPLAEVLRMLRREPGAFVSGEEIATALGVSRTAVWKYIRQLAARGYVIARRSRQGYCLLQVPDKLYPEEIQASLPTRLLGQQDVYYYATVGSTNEVARELAETGAAEGALVVAEEQVQGRGRRQRSWWSPPEQGIWMSLVLRPELPVGMAPVLTFMAAVAVADGIRGATGLPACIKWPNDILVDARKVCGILLEVKAEVERLHYAVIGAGINVNQVAGSFPAELQGQATSLRAEAGKKIDRVALVQEILGEMEKQYQELQAAGAEPVWRRWRELDTTLGREVEVQGPSFIFRGRAVGVTDGGALRVEGAGGEVREFVVGDVSLR